jgi:hypothetical protein
MGKRHKRKEQKLKLAASRSQSDSSRQRRQHTDSEAGRSNRLRLPDQPQLERLVREVLRTREGSVPPEEAKESESWLDWGLDLIKKWGPMLLEAAPELIALL